MKHLHAFALLIGFLLLAACLPLDSALPTATPPPTDTPIPTPTSVWFPPSATPTLLAIPTYTPTADIIAGVVSATLAADVSDKKVWDTAVSDQGSASIGLNISTLAIQHGVYLASFRR